MSYSLFLPLCSLLTLSTPVLVRILPLPFVRLTVVSAPHFMPTLASRVMLAFASDITVIMTARFSRVPRDW